MSLGTNRVGRRSVPRCPANSTSSCSIARRPAHESRAKKEWGSHARSARTSRSPSTRRAAPNRDSSSPPTPTRPCPDDHFDLGDVEGRSDVAAAVFPFRHEPSPDPHVTRATALYELSLRYYVAGLAWAGSPYAFHTLGSIFAVTTDAYAAVRGFPRRDAAEDFYLLNKAAKIGNVARVASAPVRIRSRVSDRTPFGTGASVGRATMTTERVFYAPECFVGLRSVLESLSSLARKRRRRSTRFTREPGSARAPARGRNRRERRSRPLRGTRRARARVPRGDDAGCAQRAHFRLVRRASDAEARARAPGWALPERTLAPRARSRPVRRRRERRERRARDTPPCRVRARRGAT